jgi:hypothetical protein
MLAGAMAARKWNPYRDDDDYSDDEDEEDDDEGLTTGEIHTASVDLSLQCKEKTK